MLLKRLLKLSKLIHSQSKLTSCCRMYTDRSKMRGTIEVNVMQELEKPVDQENLTCVDLVKLRNAEEEECPFKVLRSMGVTTEGRVHTMSFTSEKATKFIKMGMVNKNLAAQYCHYLCELAKSLTDSNESTYYSQQSLDLLLYLIRNNQTLTIATQLNLIGDVSGTSRENCIAACRLLLKQDMVSGCSPKFFSKIIKACYKFELWEMATIMLNLTNDAVQVVSLWQVDPLIEALNCSAKRYQSSELTEKEKVLLRAQAIEHLFRFFEESFESRIQFITKIKDKFTEALELFQIEVHKMPYIKSSGRCTSCNSDLPLYDNNSINETHSKIREFLHTTVKSKGEIFVNSKQQDIECFHKFLEESYKKDNKHFDLVVDGLNVSYRNSHGTYYIKQSLSDDVTRSVKRKNTAIQTQVLINSMIRGKMLDRFKKILVIGRQHMEKWPGLLDFLEREGIYYYFPDNVSKDDLHQLYASTANPQTLLVTCDLFRDHLSLMERKDRIMLERWIDTHQCWVCVKNLRTIYPTPYQKLSSVNRDKGYFHAAVIDFYKLETMIEHEPPPHLNNKMLTWLCCRINTTPAERQ